jgi:hypothetical protein
MAHKFGLFVLLVLVTALTFVHTAPPKPGAAAPKTGSQKLKFKVSGRSLPDKDNLGTTDGYFEIFSSTDGGRSKTKVGKSDIISDKENPDWGNVFEFDFDRSKNQLWFFHVWDEDTGRADDTVGRTWVSVADYVDQGQLANVNLDKGGYLIIQSVDTQSPPDANTPRGSIPLPPGTPTTQTLRFKLSAGGLPTKDDKGFIPGKSDPYVIVSVSDGPSGKLRSVGRTATVTSSSNPVWGDVLTVAWDYKKDQRLHFKIYDEDNLREDDKLGLGFMDLNTYVARGQAYTFPLPKQGTFTVTKA